MTTFMLTAFIGFGVLSLFAAEPATPPTPTSGAAPEQREPDLMPGTLIVLNKAEASVSLVDLTTGEEIGRVPVGDGPHEVDVSDDGRIAVVTNYGQRTPGNSLTVIDLEQMKPIRTIDLGEYQRPHGIFFTDGARHVAVTAEAQQKLIVVNIESGEVTQAIDTDARVSHMVALSPNKERAYVSNIGSHSMTVLDLTEGRRVGVVETGRGAEGIDVSPDGRHIWVTNRDANNVTIVDAESLEVIKTLECPAFPIRAKFTPDGRRVLVSNARTGDVVVFDAATHEEIRRIPMALTATEDRDGRLFGDRFGQSPVPVGIIIPGEGRFAFVANTNADIITVIDLETLEVTARLRGGKEPDGLGYTPHRLAPAADTTDSDA